MLAEQQALDGFSWRRWLGVLCEHRLYFLFVPPMVLVGTTLHEGAHAVMVLALGGTVATFNVLPRVSRGHFEFGSVLMFGAGKNKWLVDVAPTIASLLLALLGAAVTTRMRAGAWSKVLVLFVVWLPLIDVSMALSGLYARDARSDLYGILDGYEVPTAGAAIACFSIFFWLARDSFDAAFGRVLSRSEFALVYGIVLAAPWLRRVVSRAAGVG